jgi:hypothetical protein
MRSLGASGKPAGGGGILATANSGGAVAFSSMTISGNRIEAPASPFGGGNVFAVSEPGAISFANSIVAAGAGPPGAENCDGLETKSLGFNIDSLDQCGFKAAGDKVNTDPQLGPLQNNGGLTATMAPALAGPAIDQGGAFGLTSDQRGILRPIDLPSIPNAAVPGADGSDIGAVEFQPSNAFSLGKLTKDKKKGTAKLAVKLPQPSAGVLTLEGKGLKKQTKQVTGQTEVKMKIVGKGKVKKALKKKGKRKVTAKVTYTPTGNSAATKSKKAKLVKKKTKKKKNSKG